MNEVPLVVGVKQSAGDLKLFADLMMMAPDKLIYSDALIYPSYTLGAHGSIAAILSAAPHASVKLWDAVKAGNHPLALELHNKLLTLWNAVVSDNLPACTRATRSQCRDCQKPFRGRRCRKPRPSSSSQSRGRWKD